MSTARKILANTIVQVIGKLVTALFSIIVLKIITGYLGTSGYGDYTTVYQYLAFFGIIADFGIYTITVKEMSRDESKIPMILGNVMGLRTALLFIAMGLAVAVGFLVPSFKGTLIPIGIIIAAVSTFLTLLNGTISSVLQAYLKMQEATVGLVIGKIASVVYMAWVAYIAFTGDTTQGFYHMLWSGVVGNGVMFAITAYYTRKFTVITYRFDWDYWKKIFLTSLPFGVALVLNTVYFRMGVMMMTFILPHTQTLADGKVVCETALCSDTEVGLYGVGMRMLEMLLIIPLYFMNSVLPVMTRLIEEKSVKVKQLMQYCFDFLSATALPIMVGGFILAVPIVDFISDPEFVSGNVYQYGSDMAVRLMMFAMVCSFLSSLFGFTLVVINRQVHLMWINGIALIVNFIGNLLLIPDYGFRGASAISILCEMIILFLTYHTLKKNLEFHLSRKSFIKMAFSAFVMGAVLLVGNDYVQSFSYLWQLMILVPLGGLVYIAGMFLTKAITPEMIALIRKR